MEQHLFGSKGSDYDDIFATPSLDQSVLRPKDDTETPSEVVQSWIPIAPAVLVPSKLSTLGSPILKAGHTSGELKKRVSFSWFLHPTPVRNVFTLKFTDAGQLVGFDLKKPRKERQKFSFKTLLKRKSESAAAPAEAKELPPGIKGKILGVFSRFRGSGGGEKAAASASKLGGIITRIKGVFSRK